MLWRDHGEIGRVACVVICLMTASAPSLVRAQLTHELEPEQAASAAVEPRTTVIPSLRLAERYDSNVFLVPGTNLEDFVTTIAPQLKVAHRNQWVEGTIGGGAKGEVFAKNPGLNYVGATGAVDLNFDGTVSQLVRGMGLRISERINYTPEPPAFAAPLGASQISDAFVQGIQARRANSFQNAAQVDASYWFSSFMGMTSAYTDRRIRFGKAIGTPTGGVEQAGFFNTDFQTLTSGVAIKASPADMVTFSHQYQKGSFSDPTRGDGGFSTQGAISRWSRSVTPSLQVMGEAGFSVISASGDAYPIGAVSARWEARYTTVLFSYSRAIAPSFFAVATPMLSQAVTGAVKRQLSDSLSVSLTGGYALNRSVPDGSVLRFESFRVMPSLEYKIGPKLTAVLSYTRSTFQRATFGESFDFDRNEVMFSLTSEWR
jgi:hypothetical protein